jgi:transcriptional regulator with XRE-family HTH domain
MMQKSLAAKLRLLRAQRGLTVKDAAGQLGVDRHTLRRIELGTQEAQYPTLAKIAEGYSVPVEELLEEPALAGKASAPPETGLADKADALQLIMEEFANRGVHLTSAQAAALDAALKKWNLQVVGTRKG